MVVACTTLALASVTAAMPLAAAEDKLKKKQHQAKSQVRDAQGDLHESSKALVAAANRLRTARAALTSAQRRLAVAQKNLDAAARLDAQMQARLQAAEHRLALARVALDRARAQVVEQRAAIGRLAASNYANGDPALMGLSVLLNSQDPAEVTTQMNTVTSLMSRQTTLLESLRIARAQMKAEEAKVEAAREAVAVQRKAAAQNLVRRQGARALGRGRARRGRHPGQAGPLRGVRRLAGTTRGPAPAAGGEEAGAADPPADHRAEPTPARWLPGRRRGLPVPPRAGSGDLALRLPAAPHLRLLGPARRHRLQRTVRHA